MTATPTPPRPIRLIHLWRAFSVSLSQTIQQRFAEAQSVAQLVAPMAASLGMIGLGVLYMGSSRPFIPQWKFGRAHL